MQLDFLLAPFRKDAPDIELLRIGSETVPIRYIRNHRARRYILRLQPDGSVRATVPRVGSLKQARAFVESHTEWIARQLQRRQQQTAHPQTWQHGTEILYRGSTVSLQVVINQDEQTISFADQTLRTRPTSNVRLAVEHHLRRLAVSEVTTRTMELAARHGLTVRRVTVRNQRSRWGSCSRRGTISLNWRLIQAPVYVRDYIIFHELAHLREPNHSERFWLVANAISAYSQATNLNQNDPDSWCGLYYALQKTGEEEKARAAWARFEKLDPKAARKQKTQTESIKAVN